jgi:CHAT domain-containing protein
MSDPQRFAALWAELQTLDAPRHAPRMLEILRQAAALVDRHLQPKMWAALRTKFAVLAEPQDPSAAAEAYREALTVWDPDDDRDAWSTCHGNLGQLLCQRQPFGEQEQELAIAHLQAALDDRPDLALPLAILYQDRQRGDPWENWSNSLHCLNLAIQQCSREEQPSRWASIQNQLGIAHSREPDADFATAVERRIACHLAALESLGNQRDNTWIDTLLNLSECYACRTLGNWDENQRLAESYARDALDTANAPSSDMAQAIPSRKKVEALLCVLRSLLAGGRASTAFLHESLQRLNEAREQIDPDNKSLLATIESYRTNVFHQLISRGEREWTEQLLASGNEALKLLDPQTRLSERRSLLQVQGETWLEAEQYTQAAEVLQAAVFAADQALAEATTVAGRLERIADFGDSSALLSYCHFKMAQFVEGVNSLEQGKSRYWYASLSMSYSLDDVRRLVPRGGALLFPNFAFHDGVVAIVTESASMLRWLPNFGKRRLMELVRGSLDVQQFGGWLQAYYERTTQPEAWPPMVDAIGGVLYSEIWKPVLETLASLGVAQHAELVWFPQAGSGVLPMHAAWHDDGSARRYLIQDYAVRYAPSLKALSAGERAPRSAGRALLVANPRGDLRYSELECAWIRRTRGDANTWTLREQAATSQAILAEMRKASCAHFATHAVFDTELPLRSRLSLAGQEVLTLEQWLPALRQHVPETIVLSACETAVARVTRTPDEFLGFPAALLATGARTVVASMWPVADAAAGLVMHYFYRELNDNQTPAQAMRRAQNRLRTITAREVMELLKEFREESEPVARIAGAMYRQMHDLEPESCPFEHAADWAAFSVCGA